MRILLDTHLLLWAVAVPERLSDNAKAILTAGDVFVSAASIWELSIKFSIGKLEFNPRLILNAVKPAGFSLLPIQVEHTLRVADLPLLHKDPFDRMLVVQAEIESLTLMTNDEFLKGYGQFVLMV